MLLNYLIKNDIDLVVKNKTGRLVLSPLINASTSDLKNRYDIDLNKICKEKQKRK